MTEEEILNMQADIALAQARADAAVALCEAMLKALQETGVVTFSLDDLANPIRAKARENEDPAAQYATFDIVGEHEDPDHISHAVDAFLEDIQLQPTLRTHLIEQLRQKRAQESAPTR